MCGCWATECPSSWFGFSLSSLVVIFICLVQSKKRTQFQDTQLVTKQTDIGGDQNKANRKSTRLDLRSSGGHKHYKFPIKKQKLCHVCFCWHMRPCVDYISVNVTREANYNPCRQELHVKASGRKHVQRHTKHVPWSLNYHDK